MSKSFDEKYMKGVYATAKHLVEKRQYGDTMLHADLLKRSGLTEPIWMHPEPSKVKEYLPHYNKKRDAFRLEYVWFIRMLKKVMAKDHQMILKSIHNVGYQIMPPHEQADYALAGFTNKMYKMFDQMRIPLENINTELLSKEQKEHHRTVADEVQFLETKVKDILALSKELEKVDAAKKSKSESKKVKVAKGLDIPAPH